MIQRLVTIAALLALLFAGHVASADGEFARLFILDDEDHPKHEETLAWWEALDKAEQIAKLRAALASTDQAASRLAARAISHPYLDAGELKLKMKRLHGDVAAAFGNGPDWGFGDEIAIGARDVVPLYRTAAASETLAVSRSTLDGLHRCARSGSAPGLVALLETKNTDVFTSLVFTIANLGDFDREDTQRAVIARGLLYGLRRLRSERAGEPMPKLAGVAARITSDEGGGLPDAALEIARATHPEETNGFSTGDKEAPLSVHGPLDWLRRWLLDLTPGPKDVDYLHEVVAITTGDVKKAHHYHDGLLRWALKHLERIPGPKGTAQVTAWAGEDSRLGLHAAATLAEAGRPKPFDKLVKLDDAREKPRHGAAIEALLWSVDRTRAQARVAKRLLATEADDLQHSQGLSWTERLDYAFYDGAPVELDDLTAVADRLWMASTPAVLEDARRLGWFHTVVHPEGLTKQRVAAVCAGLATLPAEVFEYADFELWERFLALAEVRDPAATLQLLKTWAARGSVVAARVLPLLARLGATGHEAAMCKAWATWESPDRIALGSVPGEVVRLFLLTRRATAPGPDSADLILHSWDALFALFLREGLPEGILSLRTPVGDAVDTESEALMARRAKAWALYTEGELVASLLAIADGLSYGFHGLGRIAHDVRVRAWLRTRQAARAKGQYWEATAALACHDPAAAAEIETLLASGRTWLISDLEGAGLTLHDDHQSDGLGAGLLGDLDSNCCLSWAVGLHIQRLWPWLGNVRFGMGGPGARATQAFLESHAWKQSAIFGGRAPTKR